MQKRKLDKSGLRIGSNLEARNVSANEGPTDCSPSRGRSPHAEVFFSLRHDRTLSRAQDVFLNLASRRLGKFIDEGDAVRRLEMGDVRPRKLAQLVLIGVRALPENNEGVRRLAPALMRQANNRHLLLCGVSQENTFYFDCRV